MKSQIERLIHTVKETYQDKEDRNKLLILVNEFLAKYYGLYFLKNLLTMAKTCDPIRLHGGLNTISMFSPETLFYSIEQIIKDRNIDLGLKNFSIRSLFTTDVDYLVAPEHDLFACQHNIDYVVDILNRNIDNVSSQFHLFAGYFTHYYFQKRCHEYLEYQSINLNNELFRLNYKCGEQTNNILDIHISDYYSQYSIDSTSIDTANSVMNPLNIFIMDLIIIFQELLKDPTDVQLENSKKRLFRANFFFSMIREDYLNFYEHNFGEYFYDINIHNLTQLIELWNKHAKQFYDGPYLIITKQRDIVFNNDPLKLDEDGLVKIPTSDISDLDKFTRLKRNSIPYYFKDDYYNFKTTRPGIKVADVFSMFENYLRENEPIRLKLYIKWVKYLYDKTNRQTYHFTSDITREHLDLTARFFNELKDTDHLAKTGTDYQIIKKIIRKYTGQYYHNLNSCLFNYFYDYKRCNPELLHNCHLINIFIVEFMYYYNMSIFRGSPSNIRLYRTENNVNLGLVGSYYHAIPGNRFINTTFWSTSYNKEVNLSKKKILLEINIENDQDHPFLIIEPLSNVKSEGEVLLPFGCVFEVIGKELVRTEAGNNYTLVKLKYVEHSSNDNPLLTMPDYYRRFHYFNYAGLPQENILPPLKYKGELTCQRILNIPPFNFKHLYNAYYSRTLPIHFDFRGKDYILKFYLYRREINEVRFPNKKYKHPLDIELEVYDLTENIMSFYYVTPNLLRRYAKGVCNIDIVKKIKEEKQLCLNYKNDNSWACKQEIGIKEFLSKVPYQLLEKADQTAEDLFISGQKFYTIFNYIWQVFYTVNLIYQRYGLVHFDLKPGNIFIQESHFQHLYVVDNNVIFIQDKYLVKIADYDASFIGPDDNIFISKDEYHQGNILPYSFDIEDRSKLDVYLFFKLHDDFAHFFDNFDKERYYTFKSMSEGQTVEGFLDKLVSYYNINLQPKYSNNTIPNNEPWGEGYPSRENSMAYTLRRFNVNAVFSANLSRKYNTYLPLIDNYHYHARTEEKRFRNIAGATNLVNQAKERKDKLRICNYNVHEFKSSDGTKTDQEIWNLIDEIDPDILVLQESVSTSNSYTGSGSGGIVKQIMSRLDFSTLVQCKADYILYNFVYVKNTVDQVETLFSGKIGADDRCGIILLCTIEKYNYQFIIMGTHLSVKTLEDQLDNWSKLKGKLQMSVHSKKIDLSKTDVYLVGDLNSYRPPDDPKEYDILVNNKLKYFKSINSSATREKTEQQLFTTYNTIKQDGFIDTYDLYDQQHGVVSAKPIDTSIWGGKIDHIMVSKPFSKGILGLYQIYVNHSDHTPLVCDILLV